MRPTTSSSNLFRRKLCPGSHAAEEGLPEDTSEEAAEGHDLHALAADPQADRSRLEEEPRSALERAEAVEAAVIAQIILREGLGDEQFNEGHEKELVLHRGRTIAITGHCDRWRYYPKSRILILTDKKFGRIAVEPAHSNYQLRAYAVQGAEEWYCEKAYVVIVQPRTPAPCYTLALYDAQTLASARQEVLQIWAAALSEGAPRAASEEACRYCKAKPACPEHRALITRATPLSQLPVRTLTTEQLSTCLTAIGLMGAEWVTAIKAEARQRIRDGELPGYRLADNAPRRSIKDPARAFQLLQEAGFTPHELLHFAGLSVGNAVKLYMKKGRTAKEADSALPAVLGPLLESKEVEPSIEAL